VDDIEMFDFVGETLRRLRKERGKTLEQLGEEAGLGRGQLSRIENSRQEATLTTLAKILGSQGVSRREFFHRYELVEGEAAAVERAAGGARAGHGTAPGDPSEPGHPGVPADWPEEIRQVLGKLESFVNMTFHQPRPVAQGAVEVGDFVILFRVVPKGAPEAAGEVRQAVHQTTVRPPEAPEAAAGPDAAGSAAPSAPRKPKGRKTKR
jgi:transcriptional regulator with XRE-family HTH domain